jgi:hypothetical protein
MKKVFCIKLDMEIENSDNIFVFIVRQAGLTWQRRVSLAETREKGGTNGRKRDEKDSGWGGHCRPVERPAHG